MEWFILLAFIARGRDFQVIDRATQLETYMTCKKTVWDIQTVDKAGDVGGFTALTICRHNLPHIVYYDSTNRNLKYARYDGIQWRIETVDTAGDVGSYCSIALDNFNYPHVAYYDATNKSLKYARWDGKEWKFKLVDGPNVGMYTSIAVDTKENIPHIAYYDFNRGSLKYATIVGNIWVSQEIDSGGGVSPTDVLVGLYCSIVIDDAGFPHIAYYDSTNGDLKYAKAITGGWVIEKVDATGDVGKFSSIALMNKKIPYISYYDATGQDLKFARKIGATWVTGYIVKTGDQGRYSSHAIGSSHVSYYDLTNGNLGYANTSDYTAWSVEYVDTTGNVGAATSVALSKLGYPHISYYDVTNKDLKYATEIFKDVVPERIVSPPDTVTPDSTYIPSVWIRNRSNVVVSCSVKCNIYSVVPIYQSFLKTSPIPPGESILVSFAPWRVPGTDSVKYSMECFTVLPDDSVPQNDTIKKDIYALRTGVEEAKELEEIFHYYFDGENLHISLNLKDNSLVGIELYDIVGKKIKTILEGRYKDKVEKKIDCKKFIDAAGLYFMRVKINGKVIKTAKLIILD